MAQMSIGCIQTLIGTERKQMNQQIDNNQVI